MPECGSCRLAARISFSFNLLSKILAHIYIPLSAKMSPFLAMKERMPTITIDGQSAEFARGPAASMVIWLFASHESQSKGQSSLEECSSHAASNKTHTLCCFANIRPAPEDLFGVWHWKSEEIQKYIATMTRNKVGHNVSAEDSAEVPLHEATPVTENGPEEHHEDEPFIQSEDDEIRPPYDQSAKR